MKQKLIFSMLSLLFSFSLRAQFKDSSLVLLHDVTIGYNRFKTSESQFQGSLNGWETGIYPVLTFAYAPAIGTIRKNNLTFYGLRFQYSTNKNFTPDDFPLVKYDTTAWSVGVVVGKKYFISLAKNFFVIPTGFVNLNYGKEKLRVTAGSVPFPTDYDFNVYSGTLVFQPLRLGYRLSDKSLFEINLFQSELSYLKKSGSRTGTTNKIERYYLSLGNRFLSNVQFTLMHRLH